MNKDSTEPKLWPERYFYYLQRFAVSKLKDTEVARDLVQDTFLAGLEYLSDFNGNSTERTWLTGILRHKIIDLYHRQNLHQKKEPEIIAALTRQTLSVSHEEKMVQKECLTALESYIAKMPPLWAAAFKMKYMDDVPTTIICVKLGITPSNFWTITHRSKLQLRNALQKAGNISNLANQRVEVSDS